MNLDLVICVACGKRGELRASSQYAATRLMPPGWRHVLPGVVCSDACADAVRSMPIARLTSRINHQARPHATVDEDGFLILEWIMERRRLAIAVDPAAKESCWAITSTPPAPGVDGSGWLKDADFAALLKRAGVEET